MNQWGCGCYTSLDSLLPANTLITQNAIHLLLVFTNLIESETERECNSQHPKVITLTVLRGQAVVARPGMGGEEQGPAVNGKHLSSKTLMF